MPQWVQCTETLFLSSFYFMIIYTVSSLRTSLSVCLPACLSVAVGLSSWSSAKLSTFRVLTTRRIPHMTGYSAAFKKYVFRFWKLKLTTPQTIAPEKLIWIHSALSRRVHPRSISLRNASMLSKLLLENNARLLLGWATLWGIITCRQMEGYGEDDWRTCHRKEKRVKSWKKGRMSEVEGEVVGGRKARLF